MTFWNIGVDTPITTKDELPSMPEMPAGDTLIIGGRAPTWRFGMALHAAHGSAAAVVAFFDPRLGGGVVVASHKPGVSEGDILPCEWQA
jgi:CRISPR-associated protein Csx3